MKNISKIVSLFLAVLLMSSCQKEQTLQGYLVESESKEDFSFFTTSVGSLISLADDSNADFIATAKSVKKINVAFLKKTGTNEQSYETEKATLKTIFKNKDYKMLTGFKMKGANMKVYYTGKTDSIDEIIVFGYSKKMGVGVARLLGDDMNPAKIIQMLTTAKLNPNKKGLEQLGNMFPAK